MLRVALVPLVLMGSAALPLRAPARGLRLSTCNKPWKGCPEEEEGGSRLGEKLAGFSEDMAMYDDDKSASASAWTGENGLDRAASKVFATSVAATMARLQLYKNHGADGLYADAFDSETTKGAAKAELDWNKYQAGGMRALHAIEQVSYVQYENYRLNGSDAGANSETVTAWAAGRASVLPQVDQLSTSAARPRVKEVSPTPMCAYLVSHTGARRGQDDARVQPDQVRASS